MSLDTNIPNKEFKARLKALLKKYGFTHKEKDYKAKKDYAERIKEVNK